MIQLVIFFFEQPLLKIYDKVKAQLAVVIEHQERNRVWNEIFVRNHARAIIVFYLEL